MDEALPFLSLLTVGTLLIPKVEESDSGLYICSAGGSVSNITLKIVKEGDGSPGSYRRIANDSLKISQMKQRLPQSGHFMLEQQLASLSWS